MRYVHIVFAVLSAYRLVDLFLLDRITGKLRDKYPSYLWQCSRCLSVWAGAFASAAFFLAPWLNWPFALSWLYLTHNDWIVNRRVAKTGREMTIALKNDGTWSLAKNELQPQELREILMKMIPQTVQTVNGAERPS